MNIAFYFDNEISPLRGGTERVTYQLAHHFRENGLNVIYIAKQKKIKYSIDNEIKTYYLPNSNKYDSIENINFINNLIINYSIDIIINQCAYNECVKLFSNKVIKNSKIITCLHFQPSVGLKYFDKLFNLTLNIKEPRKFIYNILRRLKLPHNKRKIIRLKKKQYTYVAENSDAFILLSNKFRDNILQFIPKYLENKIHYITNPISKISAQEEIAYKENSILYVGRLDYSSKRVDLVIKIWSLLSDKYPSWQLNIIGDGDERNNIERLVHNLKLNNVYFHGQCNPINFYNKSKILMLTSTTEGLAMVLLEALQHKVVPIAFDTYESLSDIIINDKNGIIIEPFNIKKYARKLEELITNENKLYNLSNNNNITLETFNINLIYNKWMTLFNKIINK